MLYKLSSESKLHDLAWLVGAGINCVILRNQEVAIGRFGHGQRAIQVNRVLVDDRARALIIGGLCRLRHGENRIVQSRGDDERVESRLIE